MQSSAKTDTLRTNQVEVTSSFTVVCKYQPDYVLLYNICICNYLCVQLYIHKHTHIQMYVIYTYIALSSVCNIHMADIWKVRLNNDIHKYDW